MHSIAQELASQASALQLIHVPTRPGPIAGPRNLHRLNASQRVIANCFVSDARNRLSRQAQHGKKRHDRPARSPHQPPIGLSIGFASARIADPDLNFLFFLHLRR
jgi:hypothetical protein